MLNIVVDGQVLDVVLPNYGGALVIDALKDKLDLQRVQNSGSVVDPEILFLCLWFLLFLDLLEDPVWNLHKICFPK